MAKMTVDGNFLHTQQIRVLRKSDNEIENIKAEADPGTLAETIIDLLDVTGVAQSVEDNGEVNDDQTVLMYGADEVVIESPYNRVVVAWVQACKEHLAH